MRCCPQERIALHRSRLGLKLIGVSILATLVAAGVYIGLSALGEYLRNTTIYDQIVREDVYLQETLKQFQEYVSVNQIASTDYLDVKVWLSNNTGVGILYDDKGSADGGGYPIAFHDGVKYVMPYVSTTRYEEIIIMIAAYGAFAAFVLVMRGFIRRVISDIKRLSRAMIVLAGGDLQQPVQLKGNGELSELADHMDQMRLSMIERIQTEDEAVTANRELITALSHDLRTPLTKQMGYLEVALSGKYDGDPGALKGCLERVYKATCQLKERSEELFSYFLVHGDADASTQTMEALDGPLLGQLLEEQAEFLKSKGFRVERQPIGEAFTLSVSAPYLSRIFDNISSNIVKYADPARPVRALCELNGGTLSLAIVNAVRQDDAAVQSTMIGLRSAQRLAGAMNGTLTTAQSGGEFRVTLSLPIGG